MKEEKKVNLQIILMIIIVFLLMAILVYLVFFNKKEVKLQDINNIEEKNNTSSNNEDLDNVEEILINKINKYNLYNLTTLEKDTKYGSVPTQELLYAMFTYTFNGKDVSKKEVDQYFDEVLKIKMTEYPNYQCLADFNNLFEYDSKKEAYVFDRKSDHAHEDGHYSFDFISIGISKNSDTYYTIDIVPIINEPGEVYVENTKGENIDYPNYEELIDLEGEEYFDKVHKYFEGIKDKLKNVKPVFQYTFEKIDDGYYLREFKKVQ